MPCSRTRHSRSLPGQSVAYLFAPSALTLMRCDGRWHIATDGQTLEFNLSELISNVALLLRTARHTTEALARRLAHHPSLVRCTGAQGKTHASSG